jgi:hypothetical protein
MKKSRNAGYHLMFAMPGMYHKSRSDVALQEIAASIFIIHE